MKTIYSVQAVNYRFMQDPQYRRNEIINLNLQTRPKPEPLIENLTLEEKLKKFHCKEEMEIY
jgi:hypothetical protein